MANQNHPYVPPSKCSPNLGLMNNVVIVVVVVAVVLLEEKKYARLPIVEAIRNDLTCGRSRIAWNKEISCGRLGARVSPKRPVDVKRGTCEYVDGLSMSVAS